MQTYTVWNCCQALPPDCNNPTDFGFASVRIQKYAKSLFRTKEYCLFVSSFLAFFLNPFADKQPLVVVMFCRELLID